MELFIPDLKKAEGRFLDYQGVIEINGFNSKEPAANAPPIEITMQAAYVNKRVLIRGNWRTAFRGECARCLQETSYTMQETFREELIHLQPGETGNTDAMDEQMFFKGDRLTLDTYFMNSFLIAQPMRILCSEECKGLCPICGQDRNISVCSCAEEQTDERWNALKAIKNA